MGGVLPAVGSILSLGLVGSAIASGKEAAPSELDIPVFPEDSVSSIDDEIATQTDRNMALRRQAASRSRSLTNIQDNPITEDSLLRLLSEE